MLALLAGDQNFATALGGAQVAAAFGAIEVFIHGAVLEFFCLVFKPAAAGTGEEVFHRQPYFIEGVQLFFAGGYIAGEHAENGVKQQGVVEDHAPPQAEDLPHQGDDHGQDKQENIEGIAAVTAIHKTGEFIQ